jgi:membrane-associated phospholipid phosphatase
MIKSKPVMKHVIFSIAFVLVIITTSAQKNDFVNHTNYEAASWRTILLDSPQLITIAPPPGAAASKAEIKKIKQAMKGLDAKKIQEIKYWDAGAPAYRWNQVCPKLIELKPAIMLRIPTAWMNLAIYDATILAWREKIKYKRQRPAAFDPSLETITEGPNTYSYPCEHSVTAAAAAYVMAYFLPEKADSIIQLARSASQSRIEAGLQFPSDVDAGWKLGEQVARQIIEQAKKDESATVRKGEINKDPKKWTGSFPMGIELASFSPIVLHSPAQFRPAAPPSFEAEMKELRDFKQTFKSRSLAFYWANNGGFDFWSGEAGLKMFEYRMMDDAPAVARIYAILHCAYHDAAIAIFDAKYAYWGIRPVQYESSYKPLITTPPFPGYPSGHATGAATTSGVLSYFFPADAKYFQQLAQDCADSRFYAGIHFKTDNETGLKLGKELAKYIVDEWMKQ